MRRNTFAFSEKNVHIEELAKLLNKRGMGRDAKGVNAVFNYITTMERNLGNAISELNAVRRELDTMKDEQKHPVKTMLQKTANGLMAKLKSAYRQVLSIKDKIIGGCRQTVESIVLSIQNEQQWLLE